MRRLLVILPPCPQTAVVAATERHFSDALHLLQVRAAIDVLLIVFVVMQLDITLVALIPPEPTVFSVVGLFFDLVSSPLTIEVAAGLRGAVSPPPIGHHCQIIDSLLCVGENSHKACI